MRAFTVSKFVASGFGSGLVPKAPGTAGSIAATLVFGLASPLSIQFQVAAICVVTVVGCLATHSVLTQDRSLKDPGWIVIDEWAGVWITLLGSSGETISLAVGLILFRIFDIFKPPPVSWAERLPGALGVMADDLVAGVLGWLVYYYLFSSSGAFPLLHVMG